MSKCIAAHTNPGGQYPGYINFTRESDGTISVHLRGNPSVVSGEYICGHEVDRGKPGRCVPGDDHCNNYCNMAPQKGKMKDAPEPCEHVREGNTATLTLTAEAFQAFVAEIERDK